jgi:hypothetical protein
VEEDGGGVEFGVERGGVDLRLRLRLRLPGGGESLGTGLLFVDGRRKVMVYVFGRWVP